MKARYIFLFVPLLALARLGGAIAVPEGSPVQVLLPAYPNPTATLPAAPAGKATVIGGEIRSVDSVRDQFSLKVFGGKTMKILFDERTQFYRDRKRVSVLDLHPDDHASVETTLDGTKVFALRIHIFSELPQGEVQGKVTSYDSQTGQLAVMAPLAKDNVTLHVPNGMKALLVGQQISSAQPNGSIDLVGGSMVNVRFRALGGGRGEVTHIDVLAVPGSTFTFMGSLSSLDVQAGRLVIVDPRDGLSHSVMYDPSQFPVSSNLQVGSYLKVITRFDGSQYRASEIAVE